MPTGVKATLWLAAMVAVIRLPGSQFVASPLATESASFDGTTQFGSEDRYIEDLRGVVIGKVTSRQRAANTAIINTALTNGLLHLRAGSRIEIASSLVVPSGSGIIGDRGAAMAIIAMPAAEFTNRSDTDGRYRDNAVAINFSGQLAGAFRPASGVRLENLRVLSQNSPGRRLRAIVGRNVADCIIRNVEVAGIPSGVGIALASARNCAISDVHVSKIIDKAQWAFSPQSTGIEVDNDLVNDVPSFGVTIQRFRIENITIEGASLAKWGYQTDGINIVNSRSRVAIAQGQIANVGEGIDMFGSDGSISDVTIDNAYIFGLKFIHGASRNVVRNVTITNAGLAGVTFAGSDQASTDTSGNVITGLTVTNIDPRGVWKENSTGGIVVAGRGSRRRPINNQVIGARIDLGPNGKYGWVDGSTGWGNRASDLIIVPGRSMDRAVLVQYGGSVVELRGSAQR